MRRNAERKYGISLWEAHPFRLPSSAGAGPARDLTASDYTGPLRLGCRSKSWVAGDQPGSSLDGWRVQLSVIGDR